MLQAKALSKQYGPVKALQSLDLTIAKGELFCLLGANGAGKTTTIQLLMGFIKPTSGAAYVDGVQVDRQLAEARKQLAYIPEHVHLYPNLSGLENLAYFAGLAGVRHSEAALKDLLVRAGLEGDASLRYVSGYSKGMRQKVGIAIALAKDAKALLLDEPTSGLDPEAANHFGELLLELKGEGMAILMASHDLFRCREVGDRVGIMKRGQLLNVMDTASLTTQALESVYVDLMRADHAEAHV